MRAMKTMTSCLAGLSLALLVSMPGQAQESHALRRSGTVTISQGQAGFIITAGYGGGVLKFKGRSYPFKIGGLGLGGMGASSIEARGTVYDMNSIRQFPGTYIAARTGMVVGDKSVGKMWLKNDQGVVMALVAKRKGLMLSMGADGVVISMR